MSVENYANKSSCFTKKIKRSQFIRCDNNPIVASLSSVTLNIHEDSQIYSAEQFSFSSLIYRGFLMIARFNH